MGLQSGLLHLILKCDAQQQEQRTQNTHAAQRGLGELAVPLFIIRGGLPNVYGTACAAALRGTDRDYGFSVSHGSDGAVGVHNSYRRVRACPLQCHSGRFLYSHSGDQVLLAADAVQQKNVCIQRDFANFGSDRYGVQVSVSPCVVYALMTALPGASAVTRPLASTEATTGAELLHR